MADIASTLRGLFTTPRRRRRPDLVLSAYCEVHGTDIRADGGGRQATDRQN